jgi:hypothetical protein
MKVRRSTGGSAADQVRRSSGGLQREESPDYSCFSTDFSPIGSITEKTAPRGSFGIAQSRPPCASTIDRQIANPVPKPPGLVVCARCGWSGLINAVLVSRRCAGETSRREKKRPPKRTEPSRRMHPVRWRR